MDMKDWLDLIYKVLTGIFVLWMFINRLNDKTHSRISTLEKRVDDRHDLLSNKIARIESDIDNAIDVDDIKAIHKRIDEILRSSSKTEGQLDLLNQSVKSINDHLINHGVYR